MSFWCQFLDPHLMTCTNQILVSGLLLYLDLGTSTLGRPYLSCCCPLLLYNHQDYRSCWWIHETQVCEKILIVSLSYVIFRDPKI